jgi:hypothetical protein
MTDKPMPLCSLVAFSLKNVGRNFSKYLLLIIIAGILPGIGVGITFLLPRTGLLLVLLSIIIASFGFLKNILNLCQNKKMDIKVFVELKQKSAFNLAIILVVFLLIFISILLSFIYKEIYDITLLILLFLIFLCFYFFLSSIFAPFLVIDQNFGPIEAIKESIKLTKGNRIKIFLGYLLVTVFTVLLWGFIALLMSIIFAVIDYHPYNTEEVENWEVVVFYICNFFLFLFFCANAYLHLTGQLNEFDETKGEMRNEP